MNRRRSFHEADTRGGAHFPRPRSDRNTRGRPIRRTPAGGGAAPHPARPSPGGGGRAVRPADHRRGGGGLFRGVAVLCPSLPQNAVQTVGASQTSGDYTLTVEEAVVDDSNFMLLLALTRADGEPIDPEASLTTNSMDLEVTVDGHYFGRATDYQLSPDGKTIYICYENTGALTETSILGKPITLTADGVAVRLLTMTEIFVSSVTTLFPYLRLRNGGLRTSLPYPWWIM